MLYILLAAIVTTFAALFFLLYRSHEKAVEVLTWATKYFFARYGGCTLPMLEACQDHTRAVRGQSGMLLFVVVSISSVIAGLSWWQISKDGYVGIGIGTGWFLLFSLVDRSLMSSLDGLSPVFRVEGETRLQQFKRLFFAYGRTLLSYSARIAIVLLTAYVNTTVAVGYFFQADIERIIAARSVTSVQPYIAARDRALQQYSAMVTSWEGHLSGERNVKQLHVEAGNTDRADEIGAEIERKQAEFVRIKQSGVEVQALKAAEAALAEATTRAAEPTGIEERDAILKELAKKNPMINLVYWMILVIELMAFIAKAVRGKDEYDKKVTEYKNQTTSIT